MKSDGKPTAAMLNTVDMSPNWSTRQSLALRFIPVNNHRGGMENKAQ